MSEPWFPLVTDAEWQRAEKVAKAYHAHRLPALQVAGRDPIQPLPWDDLSPTMQRGLVHDFAAALKSALGDAGLEPVVKAAPEKPVVTWDDLAEVTA